MTDAAFLDRGEGDRGPVRRRCRMGGLAGNLGQLLHRAVERDRVDVGVAGLGVPIRPPGAGDQQRGPVRRPYQAGRHVVREAIVPRSRRQLPCWCAAVGRHDENVEHAFRQLAHRVMPVEQPVGMARRLGPGCAVGRGGQAQPGRQRRIHPGLERQAAAMRGPRQLAHRRGRAMQHASPCVGHVECQRVVIPDPSNGRNPAAVRRSPREQRALGLRHVRPGGMVVRLHHRRDPTVRFDVPSRDNGEQRLAIARNLRRGDAQEIEHVGGRQSAAHD